MEEKFCDGKLKFFEQLKSKCDLEELKSNPLKRWALYCLTAENFEIDIDVSEWAMNQYKSKFKYLESGDVEKQKKSNGDEYEYKYELKIHDGTYRGDTMTSYGNFIRKYFCEKYSENKIGKIGCARQILQGKDKEIDDYMKKFAYLYHTIGNLTPVPLYFNNERSGSFADCDFWDITMYHIYRWCNCKKPDDAYISKLLNPCNRNEHLAKSMEQFKCWMKNFDNNWKLFVEENHLKSYIDVKSDEWHPVEFWTGHFASNRKITSLSLPELKDAVEIINGCIEGRNKELQD